MPNGSLAKGGGQYKNVVYTQSHNVRYALIVCVLNVLNVNNDISIEQLLYIQLMYIMPFLRRYYMQAGITKKGFTTKLLAQQKQPKWSVSNSSQYRIIWFISTCAYCDTSEKVCPYIM